MTDDLRAPEERTCERCGRHEVFDDADRIWRVGDAVGEPFCVHDWDITGAFSPVERSAD